MGVLKYSRLGVLNSQFHHCSPQGGWWTCGSCPLTLATSAALFAHARDRHWDARGLVSCPVRDCDIRFVTRYSIPRHLRSAHTREMFFVCDNCGRKFAALEAKTKHVKRCQTSQTRVKTTTSSKITTSVKTTTSNQTTTNNQSTTSNKTRAKGSSDDKSLRRVTRSGTGA